MIGNISQSSPHAYIDGHQKGCGIGE